MKDTGENTYAIYCKGSKCVNDWKTLIDLETLDCPKYNNHYQSHLQVILYSVLIDHALKTLLTNVPSTLPQNTRTGWGNYFLF